MLAPHVLLGAVIVMTHTAKGVFRGCSRQLRHPHAGFSVLGPERQPPRLLLCQHSLHDRTRGAVVFQGVPTLSPNPPELTFEYFQSLERTAGQQDAIEFTSTLLHSLSTPAIRIDWECAWSGVHATGPRISLAGPAARARKVLALELNNK